MDCGLCVEWHLEWGWMIRRRNDRDEWKKRRNCADLMTLDQGKGPLVLRARYVPLQDKSLTTLFSPTSILVCSRPVCLKRVELITSSSPRATAETFYIMGLWLFWPKVQTFSTSLKKTVV